MINVLFYGNCQIGAIKSILNLPKNKYNCTHLECYLTNIDKKKFKNIIENSNIIITQTISDNYKNKDYLGTSFIVKNAKENCKIFLFTPCYLNFYYPDLTYKKNKNGEIIHSPSDYHYNFLIQSFKEKLPIEKYIDKYVNNIDLYDKKCLDKIANESILELERRFLESKYYKKKNKNVILIPIYNFIKENYKKKLLFYSMNHPTKFLLHNICEKIINYLKIENNMNYNIDPLNNPRCILYKSIQKCVNFDIEKHHPKLHAKNTVKEITELYYNAYKKIKINL